MLYKYLRREKPLRSWDPNCKAWHEKAAGQKSRSAYIVHGLGLLGRLLEPKAQMAENAVPALECSCGEQVLWDCCGVWLLASSLLVCQQANARDFRKISRWWGKQKAPAFPGDIFGLRPVLPLCGD